MLIRVFAVVMLARASFFDFLTLKRIFRLGTQLHSLLVTHLGGNANNGSNAGSFYWNLNNDSSNRNRNIGAHVYLPSYRKEVGSRSLDQTCCHRRVW